MMRFACAIIWAISALLVTASGACLPSWNGSTAPDYASYSVSSGSQLASLLPNLSNKTGSLLNLTTAALQLGYGWGASLLSNGTAMQGQPLASATTTVFGQSFAPQLFSVVTPATLSLCGLVFVDGCVQFDSSWTPGPLQPSQQLALSSPLSSISR